VFFHQHRIAFSTRKELKPLYSLFNSTTKNVSEDLDAELLSSFSKNVKVSLKKHDLELLQYSSVLFGNRFELNIDLKAIVEMTRPNKHQSRTVGQIAKLPSKWGLWLPSNFMHCGAKF